MAELRYSAKGNKDMLLHITGSIVFLLVILLPVFSISKIKDGISCSNCHTMHNSQNSASLTGALTEALLNSSCVGCHTGTNIDPAASGTPFVSDPSTEPTYGATGTSGNNTLAGGNFYWTTVSHRKGHNVAGIADPDDLYAAIADGGLGQDVPGTSVPLAAGAQLTCAGATGCHGNGSGSELDSLRPASHHVTDDPTLGTSVPNSFRFLTGIKGLEAADWEFVVNETDHNQYKGGAGTDTITELCAGCHGDFHLSGSSPFLRHPTDVDLPDVGSNTEYEAYITYKPETPVASSDLSLGVLEDVTGSDTKRIVTCISCHRAHGTPWDALLRWDYKSWPGGGYDGCGGCHSTKN